MAVVSNSIVLPSMVPAPGKAVIQLVASKTAVAGGFSGFYAGQAVGIVSRALDATGTWSADLIPNGSITPANTLYRITEVVGGVSQVTYIVVPPGGGPYTVQQILA